MLSIYNSLTRRKEIFTPITPGAVRLYVCGMTVYDYCHLGHARVMVFFDVVQRWLSASNYAVTYVRNITDIDDKIIQRARENGETMSALTERFIAAMHADSTALGIAPPSHEPRATAYVPQMQALITQLQQRQLAYQDEQGDVLYAVRNFAPYGQLSGKNIDDLRAGSRVEINQSKRDPLDFVLWKKTKDDDPSEARWDSPWGQGRPGWHIECSAMSQALLGEHFDIHGGGEDLQFPHHENEIAQSEGACGHSFVNYWMHNGFIKVDNEKMSKSLGNFFTIRDILQKYDGEVIRFFILRAHYRSPLNYSDQHLDDAKQALSRLYTAVEEIPTNMTRDNLLSSYVNDFTAAMDDDFSTPQACAVLFDLAAMVGRTSDSTQRLAYAYTLRHLGGFLGLLQRSSREFLQAGNQEHSIVIDEQIAARRTAKAARDFQTADRIRNELSAQGIVLEDKSDGTTLWRRA